MAACRRSPRSLSSGSSSSRRAARRTPRRARPLRPRRPPSHRPAAPSSSAAASSGSANQAADATYDAVEQQVIGIRGLKPSRPVQRQFIDEAELRTLITQQFDKDTPPAYLAANEQLYKALGLIPATTNLRDLSLDLLSGGVAGFYRSDEGKLYVVSKSGGPGPNERFYFSHEYNHALQDQNFTVFKDQDGVLDQSDRMLARASVYEGDSTLLMTQWAAGNLSQSDLLEVVAAGSDPAVQAVMDRTPAILSDTLTFPYTSGFGFVTAAQTKGGWPGVDALYAKMPASTEQILHADKYAAGEAPIAVALPTDLASRLGAGWSVPLLDTFGEYQLSIWLRENGVPAADALDRGRRLGWRPARRDAGTRRRMGGRHRHRVGLRSRREGVREGSQHRAEDRRRRRPGPAGRGRDDALGPDRRAMRQRPPRSQARWAWPAEARAPANVAAPTSIRGRRSRAASAHSTA